MILILRHFNIFSISFDIFILVSSSTLYVLSFFNKLSCVLKIFIIVSLDWDNDVNINSKIYPTIVEAILFVKLFIKEKNILLGPL